MKKLSLTFPFTRRSFFGSLGKRVTAIVAVSQIVNTVEISARETQHDAEPIGLDEWLKKIKGSHRMVYDATNIHDGLSIVWSWVFLDSGNQTGSHDNDLTTVVVFRHNAFALALNDDIWSSYKLGKLLKVTNANGVPATKNPYWDPSQGTMPEAGMSIKMLSERGAMFCVCERSLSVNSSAVAAKKGLKAEKVKNEWIEGMLPGVQLVPSGIWALNGAQENGCSYCFAG
jgi:intracellular sulfur oxidation DsrE/DsrF family protein